MAHDLNHQPFRAKAEGSIDDSGYDVHSNGKP